MGEHRGSATLRKETEHSKHTERWNYFGVGYRLRIYCLLKNWHEWSILPIEWSRNWKIWNGQRWQWYLPVKRKMEIIKSNNQILVWSMLYGWGVYSWVWRHKCEYGCGSFNQFGYLIALLGALQCNTERRLVKLENISKVDQLPLVNTKWSKFTQKQIHGRETSV